LKNIGVEIDEERATGPDAKAKGSYQDTQEAIPKDIESSWYL